MHTGVKGFWIFMSEMTVCIHAKLAKPGAEDIDLVVHSYYVGRPSPCVVIKNWINKYLVGGGIQCVEQIFMAEAATYPGYAVKKYCSLRAQQQQGEEEMNQSDPLSAETQI